MRHPESYKGSQIVVLGLARSGVGVAKTLHGLGAKVVVNDRKPREECPEAAELEVLGIPVICGGHPDDLIHEGVQLVVKNPGIPYSAPPIVQALNMNIDVVTEVEIAYELCEAPMIGITGSNGKTTTTTWVGKMLEAAGMKPIVAGNIGTPLCEAAEYATTDNWMVVELSSFQLKGTVNYAPKVGALLNLAETHLDYHGGMEDYVASKQKLFANQTSQDIAVLNADDEICQTILSQLKSKTLLFSMLKNLEQNGVYVKPAFLPQEDDDKLRHIIYVDEAGQEHEIVAIHEIGLPGRYNVENALAAVAISIAAGVNPASLREPLMSFRGVEHRLEYVETKQGVVFYNNSKATNSKATIMALGALKEPIILIAGGLDRGSDYLELVPYLQSKVKAVVAIGETKEKIAAVASKAGLTEIHLVDTEGSAAETLQNATRQAAKLAGTGDVVLLSPACASWDMFKSYEERGRIFKEAVHTL